MLILKTGHFKHTNFIFFSSFSNLISVSFGIHDIIILSKSTKLFRLSLEKQGHSLSNSESFYSQTQHIPAFIQDIDYHCPSALVFSIDILDRLYSRFFTSALLCTSLLFLCVNLPSHIIMVTYIIQLENSVVHPECQTVTDLSHCIYDLARFTCLF